MFDIHQPMQTEYGEQDEDRVAEYIDGLVDAFAESPEAQPILEEKGGLGYTGMMLDYYFNHLGGSVPEMSLRDFNEVVFGLIPAKVSTSPESAPAIIAELRAFWAFVQRQYGLKNAAQILASLDARAEPRLKKELANPRNWGMAKTIVMKGFEAGYDMSTQEGSTAFMAAYNASLLGGPLGGGLPLLPEEPVLDWDFVPEPLPSPLSYDEKKKKRKEKKRQRQAKKRNRK